MGDKTDNMNKSKINVKGDKFGECNCFLPKKEILFPMKIKTHLFPIHHLVYHQ